VRRITDLARCLHIRPSRQFEQSVCSEKELRWHTAASIRRREKYSRRDVSLPELPFGSVKRSGYGKELSSLGIEEFVNKKLIFVPNGRPQNCGKDGAFANLSSVGERIWR
jgi:hypothetical protein